MYTSLLQDARLFDFLFQCDRDLAAAARTGKCVWCGDALHMANYPRKPRGGPGADLASVVRLSLCCAREGCRKRHTPPSLRFLGRRVYWGAVFVLIGVMWHGATVSLPLYRGHPSRRDNAPGGVHGSEAEAAVIWPGVQG